MTLEKGSMLLQVPKGLGGAKIHTAAVTAAITGTTRMMEYSPVKYLKVLVLEGSLRLSRNGSHDSLVLHPGKMRIQGALSAASHGWGRLVGPGVLGMRPKLVGDSILNISFISQSRGYLCSRPGLL